MFRAVATPMGSGLRLTSQIERGGSMQEKFSVQNVKCGGCASNIRNGLGALSGVSNVDVEIAGGTVTVQGDNLSRTTLAQKLAELGYPEAPAK